MKRNMHTLSLSLLCGLGMLWAGPASAQDHYEWEPDEGLHEEEWYDPSDWFDDWGEDRDTIDYEYDDWDWGFNDYGYDAWDYNDYGYGNYDYDVYDAEPDFDDYDYDYGLYRNERNTVDYQNQWQRNQAERQRDRARQNQNRTERDAQRRSAQREISGQIVGMQRIGARDGKPESLRLQVRTDDGRTRALHMGDRAYFEENRPRFTKNERIKIRGSEVNVDGRRLFKAEQIRSRNGNFNLPSYEYDQTIRGRLVGVKKAATRNGDLEAVVAKVRTDEGRTMNVLLGSPDDLRQAGTVLRPNSRVNVDGWTRNAGGDRTFFIQDVQVVGQDRGMRNQNRQREQSQQQRDAQMRDQTRQQRDAQMRNQVRQQRDAQMRNQNRQQRERDDRTRFQDR